MSPRIHLNCLNPQEIFANVQNKLTSNTSDEINLQSKQNIICHVAKVKSAMSTHHLADPIPFLAYVIFLFESNASIKPEKCISQALKTK